MAGTHIEGLHEALLDAHFKAARQYATAARTIDPAWQLTRPLSNIRDELAAKRREAAEKCGRPLPVEASFPLVSSICAALTGDRAVWSKAPPRSKGSSTDLIPLLQDLAPKVTAPLFFLPLEALQRAIVARDCADLLSSITTWSSINGMDPVPLIERLGVEAGALGHILDEVDTLYAPPPILEVARRERRERIRTNASTCVTTRPTRNRSKSL